MSKSSAYYVSSFKSLGCSKILHNPQSSPANLLLFHTFGQLLSKGQTLQGAEVLGPHRCAGHHPLRHGHPSLHGRRLRRLRLPPHRRHRQLGVAEGIETKLRYDQHHSWPLFLSPSPSPSNGRLCRVRPVGRPARVFGVGRMGQLRVPAVPEGGCG